MSIKNRKEFERIEMQKLILNSAMELFIKEGYNNVSIRNIATEIEYSPATIYLYFKDKEALLFELHKIAFEKFNKALRSSGKGIEDPLVRLCLCGEAYMKFALKNFKLYELMFISKSPGDVMERTHDWNSTKNSYDYLKGLVIECAEKGYWLNNNSTIESVTFMSWSFVHGMASLIIRKRTLMPVSSREDIIKDSISRFYTNLNQDISKKKLVLKNKSKKKK